MHIKQKTKRLVRHHYKKIIAKDCEMVVVIKQERDQCDAVPDSTWQQQRRRSCKRHEAPALGRPAKG